MRHFVNVQSGQTAMSRNQGWRDLIAETAEQAIIRAREFAGNLDNALILIALVNSEREGKSCDETALSTRIGMPRTTLLRRIDDLAKRGRIRIEAVGKRKIMRVTSQTKRQLFQFSSERFATIAKAL